MIFPHPPAAVLAARDRVRPLFRDRRGEALGYHRRHGYYPIMHLIAFRRSVIEAHPWLAQAIMAMWEAAKAQSREFYDDPGYAQLAFARNALEAQQAEWGRTRGRQASPPTAAISRISCGIRSTSG